MKLSLICLLVAFYVAACVSAACADDLPRHGVMGVVVSARDANEPEDPASNPPTVKKPGDELFSVSNTHERTAPV